MLALVIVFEWAFKTMRAVLGKASYNRERRDESESFFIFVFLAVEQNVTDFFVSLACLVIAKLKIIILLLSYVRGILCSHKPRTVYARLSNNEGTHHHKTLPSRHTITFIDCVTCIISNVHGKTSNRIKPNPQ